MPKLPDTTRVIRLAKRLNRLRKGYKATLEDDGKFTLTMPDFGALKDLTPETAARMVERRYITVKQEEQRKPLGKPKGRLLPSKN